MGNDYTRFETKGEFLRLVAELAADRDLQTWKNGSAPDFVEALGRWLEDADGFYRNAGRTMDTSQPSWQLFADMLQAARIYESFTAPGLTIRCWRESGRRAPVLVGGTAMTYKLVARLNVYRRKRSK